MTTSVLVAPLGLRGAQQPRIASIPPFVSSSGREAIELARMAKLYLDPWEELVLANALNERADGKWAAFEVGVTVSRQNGKGSILEARELAGLFLLDERLLIHSAHQFDTSLEAFRRLLMLIEDTPDFDRRVQRVSRSHGEEGIELKKNPKTGLRQRIRFRTRTKGGGRGFTGDLLVLDEDMILPEAMHGALLPTLSARPNPQVWYTGSAVDEEDHEHGVVKARIRERGLKGDDPSLMYAEWSADVQAWLEAHGLKFDERRGELEQINAMLLNDPETWVAGNPGLGIRISAEHVQNERRSMSIRKFAVERLGIGAWPDLSIEASRVISEETWLSLADPESTIVGGKVFATDVNPDRTWGSIGVAGAREDGLRHVEIVDHRRGTGWIIYRDPDTGDVKGRLVELHEAHPGSRFVIDARGPAAAFIELAKEADLDVIEASTQDYAQACGGFYDAADQSRVRYPAPQPELDEALVSARTAPLGDAWKWARRSATSADISPVVVVTLALWGSETQGPSEDLEPLIAWSR